MIAKMNNVWGQQTVSRINSLTVWLGQQYPWFKDLSADKQFDCAIRFLNAEKMGFQRYKLLIFDTVPVILSLIIALVAMLSK